jgi:hypothetical protein
VIDAVDPVVEELRPECKPLLLVLGRLGARRAAVDGEVDVEERRGRAGRQRAVHPPEAAQFGRREVVRPDERAGSDERSESGREQRGGRSPREDEDRARDQSGADDPSLCRDGRMRGEHPFEWDDRRCVEVAAPTDERRREGGEREQRRRAAEEEGTA